MAQYSLGIDIGGTFTDLVAYDHDTGQRWSRKVLTTHDDPARAVAAGAAALLAQARLDPAAFSRIVHATTLFTNALIERKGAVTGLITTAGFRDTLEIGRERKYELYDLAIAKPEPLVPRHLRLEVVERTKADGRIARRLDTRMLAARAAALAKAGVEAIAVVFLHAYANPRHEAAAARLIARRHPGIAVTTSHEVAPEIREYERASTTAANAYLKPLAQKYLALMARRVSELGIPAPLLLMLSSGGLTHVQEAQRVPVQMLESGPAAGAIAAAFFGQPDSGASLRSGGSSVSARLASGCGSPGILAFDMGGTTAKLSLVDGGEPLTAYSFEAARQRRFVEGSGLPIRISTIELIEIGAGGGSIAAVDEIGLLKVGPRSAGSHPGPAAYGQGGREPTVTDADFLLGYLNPDYFAGGEVAVDMAAALSAVEGLSRRLGLPSTKVAWGIHDIVNENMAGAARVHIAERGRDPRAYALLCTGGAGPVHAYSVAGKLGIGRVICPPSAGVASALGLLVAPARVDRVATVGIRLDRGSIAVLDTAFARLEAEARSVLALTGLKLETATVQRLADGRFLGQGFDLVVPLPAGPYEDSATGRAALRGAFETAYRDKFALTPPGVPVEFINIRVAVRAPVSGSEVVREGRAGGGARTALKGTRRAYFPGAGGWVETAVYDRYRLGVGDELAGPAVVEEEGSTLVVGPGAVARVVESGNIVMTLAPHPGALMTSQSMPFDAITLEVLWTRIISVVDEAAKAIVHTSFSTLSNEANDFACVLTDARGFALAQNSGSIPSFIGTLPATVRHFLAGIGAQNMRPGDVLITNDPWQGTGHMSDVCLVKPIFHQKEGTGTGSRPILVAFAATTSHMPDIGGRIRAIEARELFEEGFHIPLTHLIRAGQVDETLLGLLRANVRTPDQTVGDIWAQVSANELMENRVRRLMEEYGLDSLEGLGDELFARSERAMRAAIRAVPDGTYRYGIETDGFEAPYRFRVALTVRGDEIVADFTGTSPAQPRAINCVMAYTYAMTAYAVRCALLPGLPNNEGMYRPVKVEAPEGCLLNPKFPAAVVSRAQTGHYVPILILGALHQVIPDRVAAAAGSPLWAVAQSGVRDDGRPYTTVLFFNGGMGATAQKDGEHVLSWPSNISSTPVEVAERNSPLFFHYKRMRPGSGGRGRFRGGLGQDILIESESKRPIVMSFMAERTRFPAPGLADGGAGGLGTVQINGKKIDHRRQHVLERGDRVLVSTPGGGGYGPAGKRSRERRARDRQGGYVGRGGT